MCAAPFAPPPANTTAMVGRLTLSVVSSFDAGILSPLANANGEKIELITVTMIEQQNRRTFSTLNPFTYRKNQTDNRMTIKHPIVNQKDSLTTV